MATANINFRDNSNNNLFSAQFIVTTPDNSVKTELPTNFSTTPSFAPAQFAMFNSTDSNSKYVTWRSVDISGQPAGAPNYLNVYPTTGLSLDIWSGDLYDAIVTSGGGVTWSFLDNDPEGRIYNLSTTKTTLIYDYANRTAIKWGRGGTITFS